MLICFTFANTAKFPLPTFAFAVNLKRLKSVIRRQLTFARIISDNELKLAEHIDFVSRKLYKLVCSW
jgi:hypothetical protein